jgi:hypothetical protein
MKQIRAEGDRLHFTFKGEAVALNLGSDVAAKFAKALTTPPPSLAKKLGITAGSVVRMIGEVDDKALEKAISEAKEVTTRNGDVILARVNTPGELTAALRKSADALSAGIVDTKVAAVSSALTALRFVKRKS